MRRMTLAARRTRQFLRRPPRPRWFRPAVYVGGALLGLAMGSSLGLWATETGLLGRTRQALMDDVLAWSVQAGLAVRDVYVDGRVRSSRQALREQLGITVGQPMLAVDTDAVKQRLEQLAWVDQASVVRLLPDSIYVRLIERQPLALWQREGRFSLVDRTGAVIPSVAPGAEYRGLRVLVGEDAPRHAADLFALLSTEPALSERVVAATWVGERRWSLRLDNDIDVLLPEHDLLRAWHLLAAKARDEALLERAISVIDLRLLPERIRLRLDPAVLEDSGA
jgi:cell division protein FtsQ